MIGISAIFAMIGSVIGSAQRRPDHPIICLLLLSNVCRKERHEIVLNFSWFKQKILSQNLHVIKLNGVLLDDVSGQRPKHFSLNQNIQYYKIYDMLLLTYQISIEKFRISMHISSEQLIHAWIALVYCRCIGDFDRK